MHCYVTYLPYCCFTYWLIFFTFSVLTCFDTLHTKLHNVFLVFYWYANMGWKCVVHVCTKYRGKATEKGVGWVWTPHLPLWLPLEFAQKWWYIFCNFPSLRIRSVISTKLLVAVKVYENLYIWTSYLKKIHEQIFQTPILGWDLVAPTRPYPITTLTVKHQASPLTKYKMKRQ